MYKFEQFAIKELRGSVGVDDSKSTEDVINLYINGKAGVWRLISINYANYKWQFLWSMPDQ